MNVIIESESLTVFASFFTIARRTRTFTSILPPTVLRPLIRSSDSCTVASVSIGSNFSSAVPNSLSERRSPVFCHTCNDTVNNRQLTSTNLELDAVSLHIALESARTEADTKSTTFIERRRRGALHALCCALRSISNIVAFESNLTFCLSLSG